ncbi:MAG: pyridoxal phosphate-dependent aminotransferase [Candidatus Bathyarchaeota archaeon]|nr:pyridoxal phosphate-dependent aminotransferase [Candidatus Bathyarchaeota archaeon]
MSISINLGSGDPEVEAPECVKEAIMKALKEGGNWTHYGGRDISRQFKESVIDYYKTLGPEYKLDNIIPTCGSTAALNVALGAVLDKGDEILMWEPSYSGHFSLLRKMGVKMSVAPLKEETGWHPDIDTLPEYVSSETKGVLICNPNNPTGTVFNEEELRVIGDLAVDHDFAILSDEIYLHFVYGDNKFVSTASLNGLKERTINIMSFSKTFSMTGYRLGYTIVPDRYLARANSLSGLNNRPASFVYAGGIAALRSDFSYVDERRKVYGERIDYICNALDDVEGISCIPSDGAFYAWFNIKELGIGSQEFCNRLRKEGVGMRPGRGFGLNTDHYVRAALVRPVSELKEAVAKVKNVVNSL